LEELVDETSIARMDFDAVKPSEVYGVLGSSDM
jgi:hypothetical protein